MAHYDCYNCGETMGNDYGSCSNCTPKWVVDAKYAYNTTRHEVDKQVNEEFKEQIKELELTMDLRKNELMKDARAEYELIYEAGKDWHKLKNTV